MQQAVLFLEDLICPHKLWVPPWGRRSKESGQDEPPSSDGPNDRPPTKKKDEVGSQKPKKNKRRPSLVPDGLENGWGGIVISRILSPGLYS